MNLPKVQFIDMSLTSETSVIHCFLLPDEWGWNKRITKAHPTLKNALLLKTEKDQLAFVKKYISLFRKKNAKIINRNKKEYEKEWGKIEKNFLEALSEILEIDWPKRRKTIYAMTSINPICPRFLDSWSFSMFYNYKKMDKAMEVIMHECCHFLYFEKWKELYPKMDRKKFNAPHIEWHLSEIIAPIILNDKRIQKLLKQKADFYPEHARLKIAGQTIPKYFTSLYEKNIKENKDFNAFLRQTYQEIKRNKNLF